MKNHQKRLLSLVLAFALFVSSWMTTVSAEEKLELKGAPADLSQFVTLPEAPVLEVSEYGLFMLPKDEEYVGRGDGVRAMRGARAIPSKFNLVDSGYITSRMENQGPWGTCWSFSALGAAESSLYRKQGDINLSERHLVYFNYHAASNPDTPEDGTQGDGYIPVVVPPDDPDGAAYQSGGWGFGAAATLARGIGAELEEKVPYPERKDFDYFSDPNFPSAKEFNHVDESERFASAYRLKETVELPLKNESGDVDTSYIKNYMVSNRVSIGVSYLALEENSIDMGVRYHETDSGSGIWTYYTGTAGTGANHAVQIVGWDDTIPKEKFLGPVLDNSDPANITYEHPSINGGWLIKNSWGEIGGAEGGCDYFYISYEDPSLQWVTAFILDDMDAYESRYDHNYQYDGVGHTFDGELSADGLEIQKFANIFKATGNEYLDAVAFYTTDVNTEYSIQVYTGIPGGGGPEDGKKAYAREQSGTQAYAGYHTVPLKSPVKLTKGQRFSVVVSVRQTEGSEIGPVAFERVFTTYDIDNNIVPALKVNVEEGQSFLWTGEDYGWGDFTTLNDPDEPELQVGNVCLKAFTTDRSGGGSSGSSGSSGSQFTDLQQIVDIGEPQVILPVYQGELKGGAAVDTKSYTMAVGGVYTVLLKDPVPGVVYTVYSEDLSVFAVMRSGSDERGNLYTLRGLAAGTAYFVIKGSDGSEVKIPITISPNTFKLDTASCTMKAGERYQVLIEDASPGVSYLLRGGEGLVSLEGVQADYTSASGKKGALCTIRGLKAGSGWVEIRGNDGKMASFSFTVT